MADILTIPLWYKILWIYSELRLIEPARNIACLITTQRCAIIQLSRARRIRVRCVDSKGCSAVHQERASVGTSRIKPNIRIRTFGPLDRDSTYPLHILPLNLCHRTFSSLEQPRHFLHINLRLRIVLVPHHLLHLCRIRIIEARKGRGQAIVLVDISLLRPRQTTSSFTIFPSFLLSLHSSASSLQIAHQIRRELTVRTSIGSRERLHDLLVVVHNLALFPRQARHALLTIECPRLRRTITEMLNPPPFMRRPMNSACRGSLNTMLS